MRSMTGFGRGESASGSVCIEISSVNRKQLELRFTLPRELASLEPALRPRLINAISRGAVSIRAVLSEKASIASLKLNRNMLQYLVNEAREAAKDLDMNHEFNVRDFLTLPGVLESKTFTAEDPEFQQELDDAFESALTQYNRMRDAEGSTLLKDFYTRLAHLEDLLARLMPYTANLAEQNRTRLLEKLADTNLQIDLNDERLLKEVLFYADRGDTTEEVTRLQSHFQQFRKFLAKENESVGRSLDFLLQEIFREVTTLGNKAQGVEVSPLVVEFKTELEKIREQIQNIE